MGIKNKINVDLKIIKATDPLPLNEDYYSNFVIKIDDSDNNIIGSSYRVPDMC